MSETTCLYRLYDKAGQLLYIGISNNAPRRWIQHITQQPWATQITRMEIGMMFALREDALEAERRAIMMEGPLHNVTHNDHREHAPKPATPEDKIWFTSKAIVYTLYDSGPMTTNQLLEWFEARPTSLDATLLSLLERMYISAVRPGVWALTDLGRDFLDQLESA